VPVVAQVQQLVAPLRYYSESVLNEGDDNQKAANGGKIAVVGKRDTLAVGGSVLRHFSP
jgi:hypothetical protein